MKRILLTLILILVLIAISAQTFGEIGVGTQSTNLPSFNLWGYSWSTMIYPAVNFGGSRVITKLAFNRINTGSVILNNQKIYLKESASSSFGNMGYEVPEQNGFTQVFNGTINASTGWVEIDISDFVYSGSQNLILHWENRHGTGMYNNNWYATDCATGTMKCLGSDDSFPSGTGWSPFPVALPNMRFYYSSTNPATPTTPLPANNALGVSLSTQLSFNLGANTDGFQVWMGTQTNDLAMVFNQPIVNTPGTYSYQPLMPLNPNTQYFWKIVATNSNGSSSSPVWSFTTEGSVTSLPYSQGFEGAFPPQGWSTNLWVQDSQNAFSGTSCAKASYVHTGEAILSSPVFTLPQNPSRLKFWWSDADWIDSRVVGHDTTYCEISTNGGQTWIPLAVLSASDNQTAYVQAEINLSGYSGQAVNFRFRDVTDGSLFAYGVFLDDFYLEEIPLNSVILIEPAVIDFGVTVVGSQITETITIFNQGTNPLVITGITCDGPFTASIPAPILSGQSAQCVVMYSPVSPGNHNAALSFTIQGTFQGSNVISLTGVSYQPYSTLFENFDASLNMPTNWSTILQVQSSVSYVGVRQSTFDAHSGTNFIKMYNAGDDATGAQIILVSPGLSQLSNHSLSFWAKSSWGQTTDTMILGTMSDPMNHASFTPLQTINLTAEYQQITCSFSPALTDKYIGFKHGLGGGQSYAVYLDDISWEGIGNVPDPATAVYPVNNSTNIVVKYITGFLSKPFSWSGQGGNPTGYKLFFGSSPAFEFVNGINLGLVTTYQPEIVLDYNTTYYWKVVPYNADGDAINCPTFSFVTMPDPTVFINSTNQLNEGFESTETGNIPLGWELLNLNNDTASWSVIANSGTSQNAHSGQKAIHIPFGFLTDHNDWLFSPPLHLIANRNYTLGFWYKAVPFPGDPCIEKMEVKWGLNPSSEAMVNNLFYNDNITTTTYTYFEQAFTPTLTGKHFIGFHAFSAPLQFILLLDDVSVSLTGMSNDDLIDSARLSASCHPNPFNAISVVRVDTKEPSSATIDIYNSRGQKVRCLFNDSLQRGINELVWDGKDNMNNEVATGIYFCRIKINGNEKTLKLMKIK